MTPEAIREPLDTSFDQIELSNLRAIIEDSKVVVETHKIRYPRSECQKIFDHLATPSNTGRVTSLVAAEEDSNKRSAWISTLNGILEDVRVYTVSGGRAILLPTLESGKYYQLPNTFKEEDYPKFLNKEQREAWVRLQTVVRAPSEEDKERTLRTALTPHENILLNLSLTNSQQRAFFWVILTGISEFEKVKQSYHEIDNKDYDTGRFLYPIERRKVKEKLRLLALSATTNAREVGIECELSLIKPSAERKLLTSSYKLEKLGVLKDFAQK